MASEKTPLVTVVVRTKDRPAFLAEALASLRDQTLRDFEVVVVNDGGAPPRLEDSGVPTLLLETEAPHGRSRALNTGVAAARGRFVAFLDDDDLFRPEHLETLARFLSGTHGYRAAYTDAERVLFTLADDGVYRETRRFPAESRDVEASRLLYKNHVPLICLMAERTALQEAGPYDETLDLYEDWEHLIRLAKVTRLHHLRRATVVYRTRDDGTNATTAAPWLGERAQEARRRVASLHWQERTPETEMAFVDAMDHQLRALAARLQEANVAFDADLDRVRADAARQLHSAGEREAALRAERDAHLATIAAVERSLAWRLLAPYRKLKSLLPR